MAGYYALLNKSPGLPLADIVMQASQARAQRERQARADTIAAEQLKLDRDRLLAQDNREAKKAEADAKALKATQAANEKRFYENALRSRPQDADRISQAARQRGHSIGTIVTPETMQQAQVAGVEIEDAVTADEAAESLGVEAASVLGPMAPGQTPREQQVPYDEAAQRVYNRSGKRRGDDGFPDLYNAELAALARENESRARAGATSVRVGPDGQTGIGLTTGQQGSVQGDIMSAEKMLAQIDRIEAEVSNAGGAGTLASLGERGVSAARSLAEKTIGISPEAKAEQERRRNAETAVATLRNSIISKLAGANVSPSEQERIMQSVPDVGDSEADFNAKLKVWRDNLEYERQYGLGALLDGLRTGERAPSPKSQASSPERAAKLAEANAYMQALIDANIEPAQAKQMTLQKYRQGGK